MGDVEPDEVLLVAREHGTKIAALWSGWSTTRVVALRKRVDGYDRGRGHPSRAEMEAMRPRMDCRCGRCLDLRRTIAKSRARPSLGKQIPDPNQPGWRKEAICGGLPPDPWFPHIPADRPWEQEETAFRDEEDADEADLSAMEMCWVCPVQTQCLRWALAAKEPDGVWGGVDPYRRSIMLKILNGEPVEDEPEEEAA